MLGGQHLNCTSSGRIDRGFASAGRGVSIRARGRHLRSTQALWGRPGMSWQSCPGDGGVPGAAWVFCSRRSDLLFSCDPSSAVASSSSWTSSASEILLGGVLDHLRDGGVAAIRVGAGTAQIRRVFGEILNINSHGGSGELPISAMALLAVVERGLYCSQSAQNLARRAAAP